MPKNPHNPFEMRLPSDSELSQIPPHALEVLRAPISDGNRVIVGANSKPRTTTDLVVEASGISTKGERVIRVLRTVNGVQTPFQIENAQTGPYVGALVPQSPITEVRLRRAAYDTDWTMSVLPPSALVSGTTAPGETDPAAIETLTIFTNAITMYTRAKIARRSDLQD